MGAVFQHLVQGSWAPLPLYSKKLSSTETFYSAFNRELLAAFSAVKHFRFLLEGQRFTLFTDPKPLTFALFRISPPWSARQQCHLSYLPEFTSNLVYLPGPQNVLADALSRPSSAVSTSNVVVDKVLGLNRFGEFLPGSAPSCLVPPFTVSAMQPVFLELWPLLSSCLFMRIPTYSLSLNSALSSKLPGQVFLLGNWFQARYCFH